MTDTRTEHTPVKAADCHFCKSTATSPAFMRVSEDFQGWQVECSSCGAMGPMNNATEADAIAVWNTASLPAASEGEKYLVWSNEHSAWWGPDCAGYTRIIANAGRYDRAKALSIAGTRDGGWHVRKGNPDEIAIPEQDAIDQYADITRAQEVEA